MKDGVIPKPDRIMGLVYDERVNGTGELFSKEFIKKYNRFSI
jgi:hypothetical protein